MLIKIGSWFFQYRNYFFAVMYAALFIPSPGIFHNPVSAHITGGLFIAGGILVRCITIGLVYIIRGGSKRQIHAETLVTEGIYKVCRNPMYLGNLLLLFGFGLFANSLLFILAFFPFFIFIYIAIIRAEESFLFNKFGSQFTDYKIQTNALIPQLNCLKNAFIGRRFDMKKVLNKEHNSLFLYFAGVLLLLKYNHSNFQNIFWIGSAAVVSIYVTIKFLKYKRMLE